MSSIYHILDKVPAIYAEDIQLEYEILAQELAASGRMRIDTDYYCNFCRFSDPSSGISLMMTKEELTDPRLLEFTKKSIKNLYLQKNKTISDKKISEIIKELTKETTKLLLVDEETKIRLARIFVQSAHPIVIRWLLLDRVQVFITYSHNIGDVMDVSSWKTSGTNSGMQSTDGSNVCIYVSCGGDPFGQNNATNPFYGDGFAALARMQIIAAQEIGHYADIERDPYGRQVGRYSANFACTKASPEVKGARRSDINRCNNLYQNLLSYGMHDLLISEEKLKFYDKQKVTGLRVLWIRLLTKYYRYKFLRKSLAMNLVFIKRFEHDRYMGIMIKTMIADMEANLSPDADVYKRSDKQAEEAIACVEAIARVPQQVMKWGYLTTRATMHDLFKIYYGEIIPSLTQNYELHTGRKYKRNHFLPKQPIFKRLLNKLGLKNISFKAKDKFEFTVVRDV